VFLILLGPPGAGKGTQGALLAERLACPRISTGDVIRAAMRDDTPLGRQARSYYDQGLLVPDAIILGLIAEVLERPEARPGLIMDGFPRTIAQAEAVERLLAERGRTVNRVLNFVVPEDELVRRLGRRAGAEGRSDDTPEAIRQRLAVYREQTAPLETFYRDRGLLSDIPAVGTIEAIAERTREVLGR
jgi:adenylate kinase